MSNTIDQRVVEMRFDNRNFESNVQESLSTLEKLKRSLNLSGAAKGLDSVNQAAKNVNMNGLGSAVETVQAKFSALSVIGVTALANITNSAVNAGKRITKALTIEPITTGFNEYETKINAVQTIMSNTQSKGTTMEDITRVLDELNTYADKTIYNFAEMTKNIGTFTAAGVGLEESARAIQGISNLAASSGSTSQQAATAMYQLSQALSTGTIRLMDWNSVVNAGMGGEKFQEAIKATAREHGVAVDSIIEKSGSFRDSLQEEWLSAEILNDTLRKFTVQGAKEYGDAMVKAGKYTREQADALVEEAQRMEDAATKVKTFTQLWDTLKESVQSGWAKTWELIFGDFEDARELFSSLSDFLGGFVESVSNFRNNLLEGALGSPFGKLADKISKVTGVTETLSKATKDYEDIVNRVMIKGEFGTGQERWDKLAKAGYDWAKVQNIINERMGSSVRYTEQASESQKDLAETQKITTEQLVKMSDAKLKDLGFTKDEIEALRELEEQSKKTGIPIEDLVKDLDQLSGRSLLINSFKNAGQGLVAIFKAMKDAWVDIFPPMTSEQLYNIIAGLHKFSTHLVVSEETAGKLQRTFKGVFAIIDILATITGGALRIGFKVLSEILSYFNMDILDLTAKIGDAIVGFRDWIDSTLDISKALDFIVPYIEDAINAVKDWVKGLKETDNIPKYIISGLVNGLKAGVGAVWNAALEIGKSILDAVKDFLGIHSPSTKFMEVGENVIQGFVQGIQNGASAVWEVLKGIVLKCVEIIKGIDFGKLIAAGLSVGLLVTIKNVADVLGKFAAPLEGLGEMFEGIGSAFEGLGKSFAASAWKKKSQAMLNMAIAIGILAASVYVLSKINVGDLVKAGAALLVLTGIITGLAFISSKIGDIQDIGKQSLSIIGISAALLLVATAMKKLSDIKTDDIPKTIGLFAVMILGLVGVLVAINKLLKAPGARDIGKVTTLMLKISTALTLMIIAIKLISILNADDIGRGLAFVAGFTIFVASLALISRFAGTDVDKIGSMMIKLTIALGLMVGVVKLISLLSWDEMGKGIIGMAGLAAIVGALVLITRIAGKDTPKIGGTLLAISGAMLLLTGVMKLMSLMSWEDIAKGALGIAAFGLVIAGLITAVKMGGKDIPKVAGTLIAMSVAIGILAAVALVLSLIDIQGLAKGIIAVGMLGAIVSLMAYSARGVENVTGTMVAMTVAIAIMAGAIAALSFIDPQSLKAATIAIASLMGVFAIMVTATKFAKSIKVTQLLSLVGVVAILAAIVGVLAYLDVGSSIETAAALSILLLSMSGAMAILGSIGKTSTASVGALALMGLVVGELAVILGVLSYLNVEPSIGTAVALGILLNSMASALLILKFVGPIAGSGVGALALMGLIVGELAIILGLMAHFDVNPSIETAASLSLLLLSMSGALVILGIVGTLGPAAFIGIGALATLIAGIGGLLIGIGALVTEFPKLQEFLDTGIPVLEKIGYALGSFFGNIIGGFMGSLTTGLPDMATDLSTFMTNLQPFIDGAKNIDESVVTGIKSIADAILTLTGANILEGIASWLTGESSLEMFGAQLPQLGSDLNAFATNLGTFDETKVATVKSAVNALSALAQAADTLPNEGGWLAKLVGDNSISTFGAQLPLLATNLNSFATNLGTFDETKLATIKCAAESMKVLAQAADALPNEGGWLAKLVGDNSISTFGAQLPLLATNLNSFATNLGTFDDAKVSTVKCAAEAVKVMAEAAEKLPNEGGWLAKLVGDNSISTFGAQLPLLGTSLSSFAANLGTFTDDQVATVKCAANAIKVMAEAASNIDGQADWAKKLFGDNSLSSFGDEIESVGKNLKNFASNLGTFDDAKVQTVKYAVKAINAFADLADADLSGAKKNLSGFGDKMVGFATDIADFCSDLPSGDSISSAVTNTKKIAQMVNDVAAMDIGDSVKDFADSLKSLGKAGVDKFVSAFTSSSAKSDVKKAAKDLMGQVVKGIEDKESAVEKAAKSAAQSAVDGLEDGSDGAYDAGSDLVDGFAAGISENDYKAEAKARAMAKAAAKAAEDALDINSPSKVFKAIGSSVPEGFALGIEQLGDVVRASNSMSDEVISSVGKSIAKISSLIDGDMEIQPTISPVLDLDNVRSGISSINSMFGSDRSVGVLARVNTISSMMNGNHQNGINDEMITELRKLRKDVSSMERNVYNFGDITYDDGSEVADAVGAIVRAAKMERRT